MGTETFIIKCLKIEKGNNVIKNRIIRLNPSPKNFGQSPDTLNAKTFESELPIQNTDSVYENDKIGLYVGVWDTTEMIEKSGPYPCDEFMWLLEGEVEIKNCQTGQMQKIQAGEAFVIPKGYHCQWHQNGYLKKFYLISEHPEEDMPEKAILEGIIKIQSTEKKDKIGDTELLVLKSDQSIRKNNIDYKSHNGKFYVGSWSSDCFESEFRSFPVNEMVHVTIGTVILTDETGQQYQFEKGDTFFVPEDVICKWQCNNFVEVFYAVVES